MTADRVDVEPPTGGRWLSVWVTAVLAASAMLSIGYRLTIAADADDTDVLESVLLLPVARQLTSGPSGLYGPFGGDNPLVLIHAPLYHRLAALAAWVLTRAGVGPILAALVAGRTLSFLAYLGLLAAAARLARLDGAAARVGWWAASMTAGAHAFGMLAVAVRPDTLGLPLSLAAMHWKKNRKVHPEPPRKDAMDGPITRSLSWLRYEPCDRPVHWIIRVPTLSRRRQSCRPGLPYVPVLP